MQKTSKRTTSKLNVAAARNNVGSRIIDSDSDSDCDWLPPEEETAALAGIDPGPDEDCPWQSAEDPATGKTYYYHIHTRETQWSKPAEMGSREERAALAAKEKRQKDFFAAMEANILSTISQGLKAPEKQNKLDDEFAGNEISDGPLDFSLSSRTASTKRLTPRRNSHSSHGRPDLVRTISTMDTSLLRDLISRAPSSRTIARGSSHSNTSSNVGGARKQGNVSLPRGSSHSHLSSRKNRIMRGVGDRQGSKIIRKQAHDDDSDEPPPLTVVTTPDLRKRESIQKNASSRSVKPNPRDNLARDDSMTLGQLQQVTGGSDGNASLGGALGGGVGGGSISIGNFGSHITFDNSFSLEESGGSLGGFGSSHHSMDSSTRYSDSHLSINSNLLTVEEGHEFEGTPPFKVVTAHDVVLEDEEEDDESPHGGSFSLGSGHGDSFHDKGAANWLDGLPTDDAGQGEDMVGYGSTAKPFKDAGYTSFFDESMANFDLSDKETQQLQKLAYISEQMTHVMEGEEESDEETSSSCFSSESDGSQESGDFDIPGLIPNDEEPLEFSLPGLGKQPAEYHLNFSDEAIDAQAQDKAPPPPCFSTPRTGGTESIPSTEVTRSPVKRKPVPKRTLGSRAAGVPRQLKSVESLTDGEHNKSDDDERSKQPTAPQLLGGMALTIDNAGGHFGESSGPLTLTVDNAAGRPSRQTLGGHSGPGTMSNNSMSSAKSNRSTMSGRSGRSLSSKGMTSAAHRLSMFRLKNVDLSKLRHVDGVQSNTGASKVGTPQKRGSRPELVRRNTCGTLHVGTTMSTPDKDATIKCVAGVFRAHILQSESMETPSEMNNFQIFNDLESQQRQSAKRRGLEPQRSQRSAAMQPVPSLDQITTFYRDVFKRAQMEYDCIIISLIYVERLIKTTRGALRPNAGNWRSILFSCMVLASKVWDDLSMWNADFSQTCPNGVKFSLKRINELEVAILSALSYKVKVPASEYAKYYFLLRSMLIKSGLVREDSDASNPLDVEGAKRLQQVSTQFQSNMGATKRQMRKVKSMRSQSMGYNFSSKAGSGSRRAGNLENVVKMGNGA